MRITAIQVANYQCFDRTERLTFDPGFNLVVGRNNTGKSALLRALSLTVPGAPHRSLKTQPKRTTYVNPVSTTHVELEVTGDDLHAAIFSQQRIWNVPRPPGNLDHSAIANVWKPVFDRQSLPIRCRLTAGVSQSPAWADETYPTLNCYPHAPGTEIIGIAPNFEDGTVRFAQGPSGIPPTGGDSGTEIARQIAMGIYRFEAERLKLATYSVGTSQILVSDASNLAQVLNTLGTQNPVLFQRYAALVREVFPTITAVTTKQLQGNRVEILLWQTPPELQRDNLAVSLDSCGTGVGQVLAILYVVSTSHEPRTIIIDEPNSFLHPGAARALIRILREFPQHQYVIATHAPEIINEVGSARVTRLTWNAGRSQVDQFDTMSVDVAAGILGDLGARLSDVLGYERVVWVEGASDADSLTLIAATQGSTWLSTVFLPVRRTSPFETVAGKIDLRDVLYLHRALSGQRAPVPPSVSFIFDQDGRTVAEIEGLIKESGGKLHFLPRRMLENYFLDSRALTRLIGEIDQQSNISETVVTDWLLENGVAPKYLAPDLPVLSVPWLRSVHAASLIKDLLEIVTDARQIYRKTTHAPWLTGWLLRNRPEAIAELAQIVRQALNY